MRRDLAFTACLATLAAALLAVVALYGREHPTPPFNPCQGTGGGYYAPRMAQ